MSLKLKRDLLEEEERCWGEGKWRRELGRWPPAEIKEELDRRDNFCSSPSVKVALDGFGDEVTDKLVAGAVGAMRPSGTWKTIFGPVLTSNMA